MDRYSMFLGRKNQYYENDDTTKCNLQIQCDPVPKSRKNTSSSHRRKASDVKDYHADTD